MADVCGSAALAEGLKDLRWVRAALCMFRARLMLQASLPEPLSDGKGEPEAVAFEPAARGPQGQEACHPSRTAWVPLLQASAARPFAEEA